MVKQIFSVLFGMALFGGVACTTTQQDPPRNYSWKLIAGLMWQEATYGKKLNIDGYSCEMDQNVSVPKPPEQMPIRWLQCTKQSAVFRLMASCKHDNHDTQRLLLVDRKTQKTKGLVELICDAQ